MTILRAKVVIATTHETPISTASFNKWDFPFPAKHMATAYHPQSALLKCHAFTHRLALIQRWNNFGAYQRSAKRPAMPPTAATIAIPRLYQSATNSGESSVQCAA